MRELIALYSTQEEAEKAVEVLAAATLGDHEVRVLSKWHDVKNRTLDIVPVSHPTSGLTGVVGPSANFTAAAPGSGDEANRFFDQALKKGGVLIAVQLGDDEYVDRAKSILGEQQAVAVAAVS